MKHPPIRTAVIPAAGLGTRFLPATKVIPKELLPIVNRPAIEYIMDELLAAHIDRVVLVLHPSKKAVLDHFSPGSHVEESLAQAGRLNEFPALSRYKDRLECLATYQPEPKGLGHAVACAREWVREEYFMVVLPDDIVRAKQSCSLQMIEQFQQYHQSIVALEKIEAARTHLYGIAAGDRLSPHCIQARHLVEKPRAEEAPSDLAIIGRYLLHRDIFDAIDQGQQGALGEIQLTDALAQLAQSRGLVGYQFEGKRLDVGQPHGFIHANVVFGLEDPAYGEKLKDLLASDAAF